MALLQVIIAFILRQTGRLLNTVFGWASTLLFGKVPARRQLVLSAVGFGAVLWLTVFIGIAFPSVGAFLLAFVRLPPWISHAWVRMAMLAAAICVPPIVGALAMYVVDADERPHGRREITTAVLRGYPITVGLALTLAIMLVVAPIMRARDLLRWWKICHVPVVIDDRDYAAFVDTLQELLRGGGIATTRVRAPWLLRLPTKVITFFARRWVDELIADEMAVLRSPELEVLVHPSDLVIRGKDRQVLHAQTILLQHLAFTTAHQTWTKEAQECEDRLVALWRLIEADEREFSRPAVAAKLKSIETELTSLHTSYEEWEVLFRQKLLVERAFLWRIVNERERLSQPEGLPRMTQPSRV